MVARYHNKWEKFQVAKQQSTEEWRPVRELERVMDVDLFLEIQNKMGWGQPSLPSNTVWNVPACCHRRAERGRANHLPKPPAEHASAEPRGRHTCCSAGRPEMTKEELLKIYLEVYKLHQLPGSPPGEPAILEEIMASVPNHPQSDEDKTCEAAVQPHPGGSHSSRSSTPTEVRMTIL